MTNLTMELWPAIGAIGEAVGALAVVVSLFYVGFQIRQSARATQAETARESVAAIRHFNEAMISNPAAARLFNVGAEDLSKLSEEERAQFAHLAFIFFMTAQDLHFQFAKGALDPEVWAGYRTVLALYAKSPGFQRYWSRGNIFFAPAFRTECDSWDPPDIYRVGQFATRAAKNINSTSEPTKPEQTKRDPETTVPLTPGTDAPNVTPPIVT